MYVTISQYFDHWTSPATGPAIEEYLCPAYGFMSLRLNVPADWGRLFVPGQRQRAGDRQPNALPSLLLRMMRAQGFVAALRGAAMARASFPRLYILRPHGFPITIARYRRFILPHLRHDRMNGIRIPNNERFNTALEPAYAAWSQQFFQLQASNVHQWVDMIDREFAA